MAIAILHPEYEITVGNAYFADTATEEAGVKTFDTPKGVESIKSVGLTRQKAETTVYASGITYAYTSKKTGSQIAVSALALPGDMVRKYLGQAVSTNKGFSFEGTDDKLPEFAFGYSTEYTDGKKVFKWFPRCKLIDFNPTSATATDSTPEPDKSYTILALPYSKLIEVEYDQHQVDPTKVPLTEDAFFAAVIASKEDAIIDTETAVIP